MKLRQLFLSSVLAGALLTLSTHIALAYDGENPLGAEFSFHLGVFEPRGESDLWHENQRLFTQDRTDYDNAIGGMAFSSRLNQFVDFMVGGEFFDSGNVDSEYRDFFFSNGDLIRHHSRLEIAPLDLSLKILPFGRSLARGRHGREVFRPVTPYFGFGGGGLLWDYRERGFFVDVTDPANPVVFRGDFHARGLTGSVHVLAGVEVQINPEVALQFEGKYRWAKDSLGSDFSGFDRFDLSGGSINAGMSFRF